jgi:EpsI family protein
VIYARLFLRTTPGRVLAVALALGLAIISNWVRVFGLVVIGYATRMTSPLMDEHATYGWVIFAVVLSVFFLLTGKIERWERQSQQTGSGDWLARTLDRMLGDAAPEWLAAEPDRSARPGSVWGATAAALIGPMVYALFSWLPAVETISPNTPGVQPGTQWSLQASRPVVATSASAGRADSTNLEWTPAFTGESQRVHQRWSNGATAIQVDRYVYQRQAQRSELISSGNRIAEAERTLSERVVGPLDANLRVVREVVTRTPNGVRLIWYWYRVAEVQTSSPVHAKLLEFVAFFGRRGPSELTAVSAPCGTNDCALALDAVYQFVTGQRPRA